MKRVSCDLCQNAVLVERYTEQQLSVQWTEDPVRVCPELARRAGAGAVSATIPTCPNLWATLALRIRDGAITVTARTDPSPGQWHEEGVG